ncbi:ABC transporter permease [Spirosoma pomorum]
MLRNYLKISLRSLWRNRLFTTINVAGLALGLACVVVLILFAQKCLYWDTAHQKIDRIYIVQSKIPDYGTYNQSVYPLLGQMLRDYPEIETGTHIQNWNAPWLEYGGKSVQEATSYVDSTFFQVFTFPLKYGNPITALHDKRSVVVSEKVARQLFGSTNPVGKHVTVSDTVQYLVTGVLDKIPANSSQQFDILIPATNLTDDPGFRNQANWYNNFASTFILLKEGADPGQLEAKLPQLVKTHFDAEAKHRSLLVSPYKNFIHTENPSFAGLIKGSIVIALFLLFIVSVNLINLNTASALPRAKEVAVRQVVGAERQSVLRQFWTESGLVVLASLILSVLFATYYLIPNFNQLRSENMQLDINLATDYPTILAVLAVALTVTLIAGTYPALYLLGLKTTDAVKGKLVSNPKKGRLRQDSLITLQFTLAVVLILGTIGMRQQIQFMKEADLGYDRNNVLVFKTDLAYRNEETAVAQGQGILNRLRQNPNVASFTSTYYTPVAYQTNFNTYYPEGDEARKTNVRHMGGAVRFNETYKIPLREGRDFSDATAADSASNAVIINEATMRAFGWKTAVGKKIRQVSNPTLYTVVGVTKDYHYQNLTGQIEPVVQWYGGPERLSSFLTVRLTDATKASAVITELEREFKKIPARRSLTYSYLSDDVARSYRSMENIWQMISFVTVLSILLACAGIFGLVTLVARQRTKEIGVRKVLGASAFNITFLLSKDFLRLVMLAILIATPIGWWLGREVLSTFAYRIEIKWWFMVLAAGLAILIAFATISYQSIRAALVNPVKSLRSE